jgi:hypothetical protein
VKHRPHRAFLAVLAVGAGVRFALLALPPLFTIDVYYYNAQAVGYLLRLVDPYGAAYVVPPALATAGAANVFAYVPGVFAFILPAGLVAGTSVGLSVGDLAAALGLYLLPSGRRNIWPAAYLLFPPVVLFSTSFLNDAIPAIAFISVAIALEARGRPLAASLLLGLALASSQEAWFFFPVYAYYLLRRKRYLHVVLSLATASAVLLPFFAWDPSAFIQNTVLFQFERAPVPFLSTGPFGLTVNPSMQGILLSAGASAPLPLRAGLAVASLLLVLWRVGRGLPSMLLAGATFTSVSLLLLAGQFFWSYLELPFVLLLGWGALRGSSGGKGILSGGAGVTLQGEESARRGGILRGSGANCLSASPPRVEEEQVDDGERPEPDRPLDAEGGERPPDEGGPGIDLVGG